MLEWIWRDGLNQFGQMAVHGAARRGGAQEVKELMKAGADTEVKDEVSLAM